MATLSEQTKEVKPLRKSVKQSVGPQLDPLYIIFEQNLYNSQNLGGDRKQLVDAVLKDYLNFLKKSRIVIPQSLENHVCEELTVQIQTMLTKKTYGAVSLAEFIKNISPVVKNRARARYARLK